ncbi:hypothetical protein Asp14428_28380 [Actinoplanes sp. NBRC 14428]|nr:hypothetical protein Asp14428_28380 [Actinoplanes sp. NBRC 14428]
MVAVSYRPRQMRGPLRQALDRAIQDGSADLVDLDPLSPAEADALLPAELAAERRQHLYALSGGNPLYLLALAREGAAGPGEDDRSLGEQDPVPAAVREALRGELDALSAAETVVARAAAVVGNLAEVPLIAATAGLPEAEVSRALDALVGHDLLRPVPRTGRFQFRHPLIRRIAYDMAGPGWRVAAHGRAAAALARQGASAPEQVHHIESSARRGDPAAIDILRRAAAEVLHSSPGTAAHWLGAALRLVTDDHPPEVAQQLLGLRAQSLATSGQLAESREVLHRLRQSMPAEVTPERARLASWCAGVERMLGRHREANALLRAELARVADADGPVAATLLLALGARYIQPVPPGEPDWPRRALAAARRAGTPWMVAEALLQCVYADQAAGTWDASTRERLDEAAALVDARPDGELLELLHMVVWLATAETVYERLDDATRHVDRALGLARAAGQMYVVPGIHLLFVGLHMARGDLPAASRSLDEAREAVTLAGTDTMMSMVLSRECTLAALTGDGKLAHRAGTEAVALAGRRGDYAAGVAVQALATAHLQAGEPAMCSSLLDGTEELPSTPTTRGTLYETLALAWSAQDRPEVAATWADRAEREVAVCPTPRRAGLAELARAHALRPVSASASAARAAAAARLFAGVDDRLLGGQAHLHTATALAADGQPGRAQRELDRARTLFLSCGATALVDRTDQEERRIRR